MDNNNNTFSGNDAQGFWETHLKCFSSPTPFVVDNNLSNENSQSNTLPFLLDRSLVKKIHSSDVAISSIICAAWGLLLCRYSMEEDVLFGLISNSLYSEQSHTAPVFVNNENATTKKFIANTAATLKSISEAAILSVEAYHELSNVPETEALYESALIINAENNYTENHPLALVISDVDGLDTKIIYHAERFSEATITRLCTHIEVILEQLLSNDETSTNSICILSADEKELVINTWNATDIDYPADKCLHQLFESQVEKNAKNTAVIYEEKSLSYEELNKVSNQLAHYLISKGAKPGKLIAISLKRGINIAIAMMAVSKSGAAYVPLDPAYPDERLSFMLEDTNAPILLTESSITKDFPEHNAECVLMDEHWPDVTACATENPESTVTCKDLAYVIYTSGSTGRPKGAVLNHQGRVNNFCDFNRRYSITSGDKLLGLASISFDMSVYDVFGTLACGGTLVIADATNVQGAANWSKLMVKHSITVWHSVPALMELLVDHVESRSELCPHDLRLVLLGGDWIPVALPDRLKTLVNDIQVVSMGGATECSMDSTIYDINEPSSSLKSIPYGFPMANQRTYILDANLLPVPIGVAGELHLGGVGVGEGYLNRQELTAEKFIENPYQLNEKIYKTGDLARFCEDGNLELLGRIDFQVKIRGFRIELGEIESSLRKHAAVKECVVLAKQDATSEKRLVAYVLPDNEYKDTDVDESEEEQIEQWQAVYDSAYGKAENLEDETFNIVSWDSSYTSEPYPEEVMRIWVNSTVERIQKHQPQAVLEIGCGTGLLLLKIAPTCERYTGTDISQVALDHVSSQKKKLNLEQVELLKVSGEDFTDITYQNYNAAVLNSIVMDFPNINYLTDVISGAIGKIQSGGVFFVGDVRDQNSLDAFHTSVQMHRVRSSVSLKELKQLINRQIIVEEEMLIDPAYFLLLKDQIEAISDVTIQLKRGKNNNEMSKFRYDVTLFIGEHDVKAIDDWIIWNEDNCNLNHIRALVTEISTAPISFSGLPNLRISEETIAIEILNQDDINLENVSSLRKEIKNRAKLKSAVDPEAIWLMADELQVDVEIHYSQVNKAELFDVVFKPKGYKKQITTALNHSKSLLIDECANNPLQSKIRRKVITKLRHFLDGQLPNYMVPSAFIIMDKFPLSPNGKLNRKALPIPDNLRPELEESYQAPANDLEVVLSDIWSQCLNVEQVGVKDGFIALGGNSLTATQVVSRIRDIFQLELPISYGFNSTINELAEQLETFGRADGIDVHETADVYLKISNMSESEIEKMLQ